MDWNLAIEKNREALKRILVMLVAMAKLGNGQSAAANRQSGSGQQQAADEPTNPDCRLPIADCRPTLPRHLHRAILGLLRPAESAARRLIIIVARGLVVTLPPVRPRKGKPSPTFLRKPGATGILMPRNVPHPEVRGEAEPRRTLALPLLDPLRPFRPRRPVRGRSGVPRISFPGFAAPFPVTPRSSPAPDDPLDATRLALRLRSLGVALDDLPRQARRFARWRAGSRAAAGAQNKSRDAAGAQNQKQHTGRTRRVWPLRPGRPPGQRPANRRIHEVFDVLSDLHALAFDVLEHPDTS